MSTTDNINRNDVETSCVDQRALGELGLDRTVPVSERRKQEVVLQRVLGHAQPDQCLVLHLRGKDIDKRQMIDLHSLTGDANLVSDWSESYPKTSSESPDWY